MEEGRKLRQVVVVVETVKNLLKAASEAASPDLAARRGQLTLL